MAVSSHGTLLKIGDGGGGEVFTTIAEVLDIDGFEMTLDREETTNHSSAGRKEYVATLLDSGEVSFECNFTQHATQAQLVTDQAAKTLRNFQIYFTNTSGNKTATFAAHITSIGHSSPVAGIATRSVTLAVQGVITWSA
jgi:hypothetical protein